MPGGREEHDTFHIVRVDELLVESPIEQEQELVLRMRLYDARKRFMREPADALQFVGQQEAGVHSDAHGPEKELWVLTSI